MAVRCSIYSADSSEYFFTCTADHHIDFLQQCRDVLGAYRRAVANAGLGNDPAVSISLFLSDVANQEEPLRQLPDFTVTIGKKTAVSILQQPPIQGKIALQAYHVTRAGERRRLTPTGCMAGAACVELARPHYSFLHFRNLRAAEAIGAAEQTTALMGTEAQGILSFGVTLPEVVRTWLYIHDIDSHYQAVSQARNRLFSRHGIGAETGFPASTGIEGRSADHCDLLQMDALAIKGLKPGQSRAMTAPSHMNPTVEYGVTFERGRMLVFGDRRHLYVSGTASIDHQGQILHVNDPARQTARAIENIQVLLAESGARLTDMRCLMVYLRDPQDAPEVESVLDHSPLRDTPRLLVKAPVCRPGWLVEIEGIAIDGKGEPDFAPF